LVLATFILKTSWHAVQEAVRGDRNHAQFGVSGYANAVFDRIDDNGFCFIDSVGERPTCKTICFLFNRARLAFASRLQQKKRNAERERN